MSREPRSNVFHTCAAHAARPRPELHGFPPEQYIGLFVKRAFPVKGVENSREHMWVKVTGHDGNTLIGELNNDPVYEVGYACGDEVRFEITDIEAVTR